MASLAEYALQNQLRTAGTEAVLQANQQFQNVIGDVQKAQKQKADEAKRQEIVKQASAQWQSGAKDQAMSTLMQGDPETFKAAFGERSKLQAESEYGQLPTQVAASKAQNVKGAGFKDLNLEGPDGSVIKMKMDKTTGKIFDLNGDAADATQLSGMKAGFAPTIGINLNTKEHSVYSKGGKTKAIGETDAAIEQTLGGQAVALTAKQNDGLTKFTEDFNKDKQTQDLVSQINSLDMAQHAIQVNAPQAKVVEQMRIIKGVTPRPAVQEVMALNYGQGWETQMESYASKAANNGMSAQEQKNYYSMIGVFQRANLDDYTQHLHSRVAQAAGNYKVDPGIVMKRVAPEMPTPIQEAIRKLDKAPPEDQAAVKWAHETLLNYKAPKEDSDKALKILRLNGF